MEADDQSSDDEVFVGEVTDRERRHPAFSSRRRTTLYFPGISRPDSSVSIFKEVTDDGTLIFSLEDMEQTGSTVKHKVSRDKNPGSHILSECSLSKTCKHAEPIGLGASTRITNSNTSNGTNSDIDQMVLAGDTSHFVQKVDCSSVASESGYGSTNDASLTSPSSLVTAVGLLQVPQAKETMALATPEDRKRKHCQIFPSCAETFQLQSPHLLVSPAVQYPDSTASGTPSVKSSAHGKTSVWTMPGIANAMDSPYNQSLLQSSESALSKLQLKSPQFEPGCAIALRKESSPIIKDFPQQLKEEVGNSPCHRIPLLKRKIAQRSPPSDEVELQTANKSGGKPETDTNTSKSSSSTLLPPKAENKSGSQHQEFDGTPAFSQIKAVRSTQQKGDSGSDQSSGAKEPSRTLSVSLWDRAVCAGGDAQSIRLSKVPRVFAPETPDTTTTSSASASSKLSVKFGAPCGWDWEECESVPSSLVTAQEVHTSPSLAVKLKKNSTFAESQGGSLSLTSSTSKEESMCTPLSAGGRAFYLKKQATPLSPDLFSSPVCLDKVFSVQLPQRQAESAPPAAVLSPIPGPSTSSKLKCRSKSKLLQPIHEDGVEVFDSCNSAVPVEHAAACEGEGQERGKRKRAKYPLLRKRAPAVVNKENVDLDSASFIFPSHVLGQSDRTVLAPEHTTACSYNGQGDNSSTVQTSSSSVPAVDQEGTLPWRPKYEGMTFADLQNGGKPSYDKSVPPRIALQGTPPGHYVKYVRLFSTESQTQLEEDSRAAMTRVNTLINGEIRHSLVDPQSSPALLTEFPAPKEATRVSWSDTLVEEAGVMQPPVKSAATPRSILVERPVDHEFPFSKDPPSPILLTRKRLSRWPVLFGKDN